MYRSNPKIVPVVSAIGSPGIEVILNNYGKSVASASPLQKAKLYQRSESSTKSLKTDTIQIPNVLGSSRLNPIT